MPSPTLHALPGLGADRRLFPAPWNELPGFHAHDWTPHVHARSIPELAKSVCAHANVRDGDILIGASLGGMVACEIASLRRIRAIFLLGSALHPSEIRRPVAEIHPLIEIVPLSLAGRAAGWSRRPLLQMFADSNPDFIRHMCRAIFRWRGAAADRTPIHRIHGRGDLLIAPPAQPALLLDGRHALSLSHAEACVRFIAGAIHHVHSPSSTIAARRD